MRNMLSACVLLLCLLSGTAMAQQDGCYDMQYTRLCCEVAAECFYPSYCDPALPNVQWCFHGYGINACGVEYTVANVCDTQWCLDICSGSAAEAILASLEGDSYSIERLYVPTCGGGYVRARTYIAG